MTATVCVTACALCDVPLLWCTYTHAVIMLQTGKKQLLQEHGNRKWPISARCQLWCTLTALEVHKALAGRLPRFWACRWDHPLPVCR
eukprot:1140511-Pelagomonas_calceolata.AAC.3